MRNPIFLLTFLALISTTLKAADNTAISSQDSILSRITGSANFEVAEPALNGLEVSLADYGGSPTADGTTNAKAFARAISAIKLNGITKLTIPTGIYKVYVESKKQIDLTGVSNLLIDGKGSQLVFLEHKAPVSNGTLINLENCNKVEIKNLAIDWDWDAVPVFVLGQVTAIDKTKGTIEFQVDNFTLPDTLNLAGGRPWDPSINNRDSNVGFSFPGGISAVSSVVKTAENKLLFTYTKASNTNAVTLGLWAQFWFQPNMNANGFDMHSCKNITLDSVTIYSAPYRAISAYDMEYFQIINSKIIPKPNTPRLFSTYGGVEVHAVHGYFKMENCVLNGILDDNIHLSNGFIGGGLTKIDDHTLTADYQQYFASKDYIYVGGMMALYNGDFASRGWSSRIKSFSWEFNVFNSSSANRVKIVFNDVLPETINRSDVLWNTDMFTGNFIIRNNEFKNGLCHAMYLGLSNGTIENNTATNFAYPSLILNAVLRWERWYIGEPLSNVIIRKNTFTNNNTDRRDPATLFVGAGIDTSPSNYSPVTTHVISDVLIENNIVNNSSWAAFATFSSKNIVIRNNQFLNSNMQASREKYKGMGSAYITNAKNIFWENNLIKNSPGTNETGLFINDKNTEDITIKY